MNLDKLAAKDSEKLVRTEQEIFGDLAILCRSPGYIHAVAALCFRDDFIIFENNIEVENMERLYSDSRLSRNEKTVLIGLMIRSPVEFALPAQEIISDYVKRSDSLLEELHFTMVGSWTDHFNKNDIANLDTDQPLSGQFLREPIFYCTESAYHFQYRDLAPRKYSADAAWLLRNKSIDLAVAREICEYVCTILDERVVKTFRDSVDKPPGEWTMLPGFTFSCAELAAGINRSIDSVRAVVEAFTLPECERNTKFTSLNAFNSACIYPFIRRGADQYVLLQYYGFSEALYETPYYWMCRDKAYADTALSKRGKFTEKFASERLKHVFGEKHVFSNVELLKTKSKVAGEIDVLVLFGDRAIVLQAKSKKLTLRAREGDAPHVQNDFRAAVQDAVNQAITCGELLVESSVMLRCRDKREIQLTERPRTVFAVTVVSDHYPALAFQVNQFLEVGSNEKIMPPLAIDIFALDTITEMLDSPLRFLSYLSLRARFSSKLIFNHEKTLLSYHLKYNLWIEQETDLVHLDDDLASYLDIAMMARREGVAGAATPDGILTRFAGTEFAKVISEIEDKPHQVAIDLGLFLLELGESSVQKINNAIRQIFSLSSDSGQARSVSILISTLSSGLTILVGQIDDKCAEAELYYKSTMRRNLTNSITWFGLALKPDCSIQLVTEITASSTSSEETGNLGDYIQ